MPDAKQYVDQLYSALYRAGDDSQAAYVALQTLQAHLVDEYDRKFVRTALLELDAERAAGFLEEQVEQIRQQGLPPAFIENARAGKRMNVRLLFRDGVEFTVDLKMYMEGLLLQAVIEDGEFSQVQADPETGALVWPNGATLPAAVLRLQ